MELWKKALKKNITEPTKEYFVGPLHRARVLNTGMRTFKITVSKAIRLNRDINNHKK